MRINSELTVTQDKYNQKIKNIGFVQRQSSNLSSVFRSLWDRSAV